MQGGNGNIASINSLAAKKVYYYVFLSSCSNRMKPRSIRVHVHIWLIYNAFAAKLMCIDC